MSDSRRTLLELAAVAVEKPWGGTRLGSFFPQPDLPSAHLGEMWLVSTVGEERCHSRVVSGSDHGQTLQECLLADPVRFLGQELAQQYSPGHFPLLFKWIDARSDLSVQVHPNDELARSLGLGENGKEETWLILDAEPGSTVRVGFSEGWDMARLVKAVEGGEDISLALQRHSVKKGDLIHVPPGTVHSIGAGILLAEIQQPSDVTFRIHDGETLGTDGLPRELHLKEASRTTTSAAFLYAKAEASPRGIWHERVTPVAYQVMEFHGAGQAVLPLAEDRCSIVTCLAGQASLRSDSGNPPQILNPGEGRLVTSGSGEISLEAVQEGWFAVFSPRLRPR